MKDCRLIVDITAQVEFLFGVLDGGPTDTTAVDLLEVEAEREVVIEADDTENIEASGDIFVLLGVGVEDAGLDLGKRGVGRWDGRLGDFAVCLSEIE